MVKSNKSKTQRLRKAQKPSRKSKGANKVQRISNGLDAGAAAYARMLVDPCNAPMLPSTYSGMGTGQYRRFRSVFTVPASVEGTYMFTPSANMQTVATHVAANAGTNYTFNNALLFASGDLDATVELRCLAACVKVRYIGPEQDRAGIIATRTSPFAYVQGSQVTLNSIMVSESAVINRLGEVQHEVKFVPGLGDEQFNPGFGGASASDLRRLGAFGFSYQGIPNASLQVEVTAIMEIETRNSMVPNVIPPSSRNTTNQVLAALGPPAKWAFGHIVAPTIRATAGLAMNSLTSSFNTVSMGARLLTL